VHDACFTAVLGGCPVPTHCALKTREIEPVDAKLPEIAPIANEDETAFIFHTSGSTSGSPKLVPCSYRWLNSVVQKSNFISRPRNADRQDVTVFMYVPCFFCIGYSLNHLLQWKHEPHWPDIQCVFDYFDCRLRMLTASFYSVHWNPSTWLMCYPTNQTGLLLRGAN
jgi:AMP-binding enzyme